MRARIINKLIHTGTVARDYVRLIKGGRHSPLKEADKQRGREAQDILESMRDQERPENDLEIDITGKVVIQQMDRDLKDFGLVPYYYTDLARSRCEGICPGVYVRLLGDPSRRRYRTIHVSFSRQATRIKDAQENEFVLPWDMVEPCQNEGGDRPYWFTARAKDRGEDLEIGDYVRLSFGQDEKYKLTEIFWEYGSVRVQQAGGTEGMVLPWRFVKPWPHKRTLTQALGDGLYRGTLVCRVDEPDRVLKVRRVNWDRESTLVEDEDGKVFELSWDETEFWEN
jgi:hypothetical protein